MRPGPLGTGSALVACALTALTGCATGGPAAAPDGRPVVVTSTDVYGSIARAVGGEHITVWSVIDGPLVDPHSYETTPADAATVAGGSLLVVNGGGYDDTIAELAQDVEGLPVIDVVELAEQAGTLSATPATPAAPAAPGGQPAAEQPAAEPHADDEHADEHGADEHAHNGSEHVWYSLPTVQRLAGELATQLGTLDPAHAADYTAQADRFAGELDGLLERVHQIGQDNPGARVVATEPVATLLLADAGIADVTPPAFVQAVEEETDPPAAAVAEMLALIETDPVDALLVNPQTATPVTDQVRAAAQAQADRRWQALESRLPDPGPAVPVLEVTETLSDPHLDYLGWMGGQINGLWGIFLI